MSFMPRLPNLLATRKGRLAAFFLLYTTEGVPLGFAAVAVATQLRRMGVGPAEIGAFVASFYLPWAFKWAFGPMIDVFRSRRFGHRRGWILLTQSMMVVTILAVMAVPLPSGLALFTGILLVHNTFAAMQDVAIDALAVNSLGESERGLANGLMFAGATLGQAVGGAGVLYLATYAGFDAGYGLVAAALLAVTAFVVLPMKEAAYGGADAAADVPPAGRRWVQALGEMRAFAHQSFQSFLGSRAAYSGVFFALLPAGVMSLSLALQQNLAVELGMNDDQVANMSLASTLVSGVAMVIGGQLSDRLGRRRTLAVYLLLMSPPALYLAWVLQQAGYVMPRAPGGPPLPDLIWHLWAAVLAYNVAMGLMYGTRSAVFMDVTNPRVAGTQFTAYMAMMNLAIAMSATWQGIAAEALGYPITLLIDAVLGPVCVLLLPWMGRRPGEAGPGLCDAAAEQRARWTARVLASACAGFVAWWWWHDPKGPASGIANTLFTLGFVAAALFLYAGTLLQQQSAAVKRIAGWLAIGLLLLYARRFIPADGAGALWAAARLVVSLVALAAAALLWTIAARPWPGLREAADNPAP
jgi:PAT family beta-lactamase induction signal transducer AmpG